MLILSRKVEQEIVINEQIRIVVTKISGNRVSIGIEAPAETSILRGECVVEFEEQPLRALELQAG